MQWKVISCYPGYEINDVGEVRSVDRIVLSDRGVEQAHRGRILKPRNNNGSPVITLYRDGIGEEVYVSRLLREYFPDSERFQIQYILNVERYKETIGDEVSEWNPIQGYEGEYEIGNTGCVRSVNRVVTTSSGSRRYASRIVRPGWSKGVPWVELYKTGKRKCLYISDLLTRHFPDSPLLIERRFLNRSHSSDPDTISSMSK